MGRHCPSCVKVPGARLDFPTPPPLALFAASVLHHPRLLPAMRADEIDYKLIGDDLQGVIVTLDPGEAVVAEAGAMMYMQDGVTMATTLDQTGRGAGLWDKLKSAGKRVLSGDSFFVTFFMNETTVRRDVA